MWLKIAIIDYVTKAYQQDKPERARRTPNSQLWTQPAPSPPPSHSLERVIPGQKAPIVPTGTINNPLRTAKAATNDNHRRNQM